MIIFLFVKIENSNEYVLLNEYNYNLDKKFAKSCQLSYKIKIICCNNYIFIKKINDEFQWLIFIKKNIFMKWKKLI